MQNQKFPFTVFIGNKEFLVIPHNGGHIYMETTQSALRRGVKIQYIPLGVSGKSFKFKKAA